ncbi:Hcp family type VI secretion system effector [Rouxiella sp. Mn2063]|uniref:Hcp family type VI secretion system effector n=1 Tax=Rouxiella sp. Mn2063 TaxID=3395262 RepID=UPI003BC3A5C9
MSNPAYLFLVDENGSPIVGDSLVTGRVGAIELRTVTHNMFIPADAHTGKLTGTRVHEPFVFQKEFDKSTPLLYRALSTGITLKTATIKMYRILESGIESEYFNIFLENVKITAITPHLHQSGVTGTHLENIQMRYESITWKYCDGNIIHKDSWNNRVTA